MTTTLRHTDDGTEMTEPCEAAWDRVLTDEEIGLLQENPFCLFQSLPMKET